MQLDAVFVASAIARLLDLKILRSNSALVDVGHQWAYHWTYVGKLVLRKRGMSDLTIPRP
jgi:hypothetical protein